MKMFVIRMANHPFHLFSCLVATVITFIPYLTITWSCMPMETSYIQAAVFVLNLLAFCTIHDRYLSMWRFRLPNLAKGKTSLDILTRKLKPLPMSHLKITPNIKKGNDCLFLGSNSGLCGGCLVLYWCKILLLSRAYWYKHCTPFPMNLLVHSHSYLSRN